MGDVTLVASASPAGWRVATQTGTVIPASFGITFDVTTNGWSVMVNRHASASTITYWLVGVDASNVPFVSKFDGAAYTTVAAGVDTFAAPGSIQVWFGEVRYGNNDDLWISTSLWSNGRMLINYSESAASAINDSMNFGLGVIANTTVTFSNLRIPEMTELAENETIDPGENVMSALGRVLDGRNIKYFARYDRTVRTWKPKTQSVVQSTTNDVEQTQLVYNPHLVKTHIRMVGAYDYAEFIRLDLIPKYDHVFQEINNPYLMSEADCYTEAQHAIFRLMEQALVETLVDSFLQFVEIEDRISASGNSRLVTSLGTEYTPVQIVHTIIARDYVYD